MKTDFNSNGLFERIRWTQQSLSCIKRLSTLIISAGRCSFSTAVM